MQSYSDPRTPNNSEMPSERPRDVFEIVSEAFSLYGKGFVNLWLPFLIVSIIVGLLSGLLTIAIGDITSETDWEETEQVVEAAMAIIILSIGTAVIGIAGDAIATGMVVFTVKDLAENKPAPPLGQVFEKTQPKIIPLIIGGVIFGLLLIGGIVIPIIVSIILIIATGLLIWIFFGIIGGIVLAAFCFTWFYVWAVCIILEDQPVTDGFRRSKELVKGDGWHAFGLVIVSFFIVLFLGGIVGLFVGIFIPMSTTSLFGTVVQNAVTSLVSPLAGIMTTLLYFDLKARKAMGPARWGPARAVAPAPMAAPGMPPGAASFCGECGSAVSPRTAYCSNCGSKIQVAAPPPAAQTPTPVAAFCPECGIQLPTDTTVSFCPNCGAKIS